MPNTPQAPGANLPAFPLLELDRISGQIVDQHFGVTLRDYFAAKAIQAAATNPIGADGFNFEQRARWAYQQADAMLAARCAK
jgi:hypothetical protein